MIIWYFVFIAVCIILAGFFSGTEIGLISCNRIRIQHLAESGDRRASIVQKLLSDPSRMLATTLVGTNLAVISGASAMTYIMIGFFGEKADLYSTLFLTPVVLILGEIVPKAFFQARPEELTLMASPLLYFFRVVLSPVVSVVSGLADFLLSAFRLKRVEHSPYVTREEVIALIAEGQRSGFDVYRGEMIRRIFDFGEMMGRDIMVPADRVVGIGSGSSIREAVGVMEKSSHSRLVVWDDAGPVGIVYLGDLLSAEDMDGPVSDFTAAVERVRETEKAYSILEKLRLSEHHMAFVEDEAGNFVGITTLRDISERIIGRMGNARIEKSAN